MEITRRNYARQGHAEGSSIARSRRTRYPGEEGTMRRITHWHRTLTVLAVGLLALAAPLLASANNGGPGGG